MNPITITISCCKGGVGKTTLATSLARQLSELNRVLLIDLDPQTNITNLFLTTEQKNNTRKKTIFQALNGAIDLPTINVLNPSPFGCLSICPGSSKMKSIDALLKDEEDKDALTALIIDSADDWDYIIIDCPPQSRIEVENAYRASEYILIPTDLAKDSIIGMQQVLSEVKAIHSSRADKAYPHILGIVANRYDARTKIDPGYYTALRQLYPSLLTNTILHSSVDFKKAREAGKCIQDYAPKSRAAQDIAALTTELLNRIEKF